jgi:hypothetical protein
LYTKNSATITNNKYHYFSCEIHLNSPKSLWDGDIMKKKEN